MGKKNARVPRRTGRDNHDRYHRQRGKTIIWIADKSAPRLWLWNYGAKSNNKHQRELKRLAEAKQLQFEEADAMEKLAELEWSESNVENCVKAFVNDRNFVGDNKIAFRRAQ